MYSYWLPCIKLKYSEHSFSYTILQNALYRDPGKGNVNADSVRTTTPIAFIFTILDVLSIYLNDRKFVGEMHIEGALMRQSRNIAFNYTGVTNNLGLSNL